MKKQYNKVEGLKGELLALQYLKKKKYKILEQNYRNHLGEIDIIAKFKKTYIFIEVKARRTLALGRPSEAVNDAKQYKIKGCATLYQLKNKISEELVRFDVIEIIGDEEINHIENAF